MVQLSDLLTELELQIEALPIWEQLFDVDDFDAVALQTAIAEEIFDAAHPDEEEEDE